MIRRDFAEAVIDFVADGDRTVLLSSHLLHEVERLAEHVAILESGEVLLASAIEGLKRGPDPGRGSLPKASRGPRLAATVGPAGRRRLACGGLDPRGRGSGATAGSPRSPGSRGVRSGGFEPGRYLRRSRGEERSWLSLRYGQNSLPPKPGLSSGASCGAAAAGLSSRWRCWSSSV